jgi:hypothetical protein
VPGNYSDIDFIAVHRAQEKIPLPTGSLVGPCLAVETKDEHDGPSGNDFGKALRADASKVTADGFVPLGVTGIKFTMMKAEHFEIAKRFLGTSDFDRLFIVHALDDRTRSEICPGLAEKYRIHWLTIPEMVADLLHWYEGAERRERISLRNTVPGDLFHLLVGFCQFAPSR